ncbi:hypothetical protein VNO78_33532 [Psophocarpus tetragonolobus]|uniref:DUF7950 domain-containing protein n=1 Tax=Psophocarpus tetragonolobus TaxID=3891 RepID=A0AAN9P2J9_PSOTE
MEGGDVWRVAASGNADSKIFNTIMLRFRPIAPKPVTGSSSTAVESSSAAGDKHGHASVLGKRPKRKYVRIRRNSGYVRRNNNGNSDNNKSENKSSSESDVAVVTLQLMPEKEAPMVEKPWCKDVDLDLTVEKIQIVANQHSPRYRRSPRSPPPRAAAETDDGSDLVAESYVTVESVIGTCMEEGVVCTDAERVRGLESDTCPAFVCDGSLSVRWVNDAYKRMVASENIVVRLKVKDSASACYSHPAFTCGVRLQYTWRHEKCTKMVPCDVWRLDCGGFAWRLDVKAALGLGL